MPSEFHHFKQLPLELRIQIWREASNVSRKVKVSLGFLKYGFPDVDFMIETSDNEPSAAFCMDKNMPAVLQVNQESRCQGLKIYKGISRSGSDTPAPCFYVSPNDFFRLVILSYSPIGSASTIRKFLKLSGLPIIQVKELEVYHILKAGTRIVAEVAYALLALPFLESITIDHESDFSNRSEEGRKIANFGWANSILQVAENTKNYNPGIRSELGFRWIKEKVQNMKQDNDTSPKVLKLTFPALDVSAAQLNSDAMELDGT